MYRSLNWVTTSHLECPFKETDPDVRDLLYTAINHVLEVRESSLFTLKALVLGIAHLITLPPYKLGPDPLCATNKTWTVTIPGHPSFPAYLKLRCIKGT